MYLCIPVILRAKSPGGALPLPLQIWVKLLFKQLFIVAQKKGHQTAGWQFGVLEYLSEFLYSPIFSGSENIDQVV